MKTFKPYTDADFAKWRANIRRAGSTGVIGVNAEDIERWFATLDTREADARREGEEKRRRASLESLRAGLERIIAHEEAYDREHAFVATEARALLDSAGRMACPACETDQLIKVFDRDSGLCAACEDERRRRR